MFIVVDVGCIVNTGNIKNHLPVGDRADDSRKTMIRRKEKISGYPLAGLPVIG